MVPYLQASPLSNITRIKHGFFTRQGGVSQGDFATLNVGRGIGDADEHVLENRRRISQTLGFDQKKFMVVRQRHTSTVLVVDHPFEGELPEADGLITRVPDLFIGVLTADCVPVLFSTPKGDMVAAVHAGWRGAVGGILENTVEKMKKLGGEDIYAALGPCIWQNNYEISEEFYDNLKDEPSFFKPGNRSCHWQFDLPGYVISRLQKAGVQHISPSLADTYAESDRFFSCRRAKILGEPIYGNGFSGIGILGRNT